MVHPLQLERRLNMGLFRSVSTSFWTDSKVADDFTPEDRYFYLYLFTNPHTNLCGCYEISMKQVALETGYSRDTVESLVERFSEYHGVIRYSKTSKEILLLNWSKYNWTTSPKFQTAVEKEIETVKSSTFREYLKKKLYGINTVSTTEEYGIDTPLYTNTITNTVSNTNTNAEKKEERHKYGEYKNVLLSDKDMEKLQAEFPDDYTKRIEALSVYMQSKGARYKDHLATIRNWARKEKQEKPKSKNRFNNFHQREYDYDDMERRLAGL